MILTVNFIQHRFYFLVVENFRSFHVTTGAPGCELGSEKVFHPFSGWAGDHFIGRMLVYPSGAHIRLVNNLKNCVYAKIIVRVHRGATLRWVKWKLRGIDAAAIELSFISIDSAVPNNFRADCFAIRSGRREVARVGPFVPEAS